MSSDYARISDDEYNKLLFQMRGQYVAILNTYNCYGMGAHIPTSVDECVKIAENFGMALRGKKSPIHIINEPKRRLTDE